MIDRLLLPLWGNDESIHLLVDLWIDCHSPKMRWRREPRLGIQSRFAPRLMAAARQ